MKKNKAKKNKSNWSQVVLIVIFIVGLVIALYPFYVGALNNLVDRYRIGQIARENEKENKKQLAKLKEKNKKITKNAGSDPFTSASSKVKVDLKKHLIGKVIIPKIDVSIPLFDTTTSQTLEYGAAVLNGTSYPVGGKGTHSVVSSHRGLPERKLFTDLNKLKKGDIFIFEVYNKKLAYKIESIKTVLPNNTTVLKPEPDRDLASLLTCTPYMLNTHRLVLKGHRVPYTKKMAKESEDAKWRNFIKNCLLLVGCILLFGLVGYWLYKAIHSALLRKQSFDLSFYVTDKDGKALVAREFGLYDKRGKKLLKRDGKPFIALSDEEGKVSFAELPGGLYSVRKEKMPRKQRMLGGIKKKSQAVGRLYPKKKQQKNLKYVDSRYIWII